MVYRGQVQGEVVVLSDGVRLPEGMEVLVEPVATPAAPVQIPGFSTRNGVPVFPKNQSASAPDLDLVNELRDDAP